jgi:hypothetical protein
MPTDQAIGLLVAASIVAVALVSLWRLFRNG